MADVRNEGDDRQALDVVARALEDAAEVDAGRVVIALEEDTVVLQGAVATPEERSAAELIARDHAGGVRNELRVDAQLRADPTEHGPSTGRSDDSSLRGAQLARGQHGGEAASDIGEALEENVPLVPPDAPVFVPTPDEQQGYVSGQTIEEPADAGPLPDDEARTTEPSLPGLAPEELARDAHGSDEEDR